MLAGGPRGSCSVRTGLAAGGCVGSAKGHVNAGVA